MSDNAEILAALQQLNDRLDRIESKVAMIGTLQERLPVIADAAGTMASVAFSAAEEQGIDPIEKIAEAPELAPQVIRLTAKAVSKEQLDMLELLLDNQGLLLKGIEIGRKLEASGAMNDETVDVLVDATAALVETKGTAIAKVGPFGALGAVFDSDIQTAIGFTMGIAKRFGARLGAK